MDKYKLNELATLYNDGKLSLYREYKNTPEVALEVLTRAGVLKFNNGWVSLWQGTKDIHGVRYGSFRKISPKELQDRQYELRWSDYALSVFFTDCITVPDYLCKVELCGNSEAYSGDCSVYFPATNKMAPTFRRYNYTIPVKDGLTPENVVSILKKY